MTKGREATPVTLSPVQRKRLEHLWFHYGNYGPETTPGNHGFIQVMLEHGRDVRSSFNSRTRKSQRPTPECERDVDAVLASEDGMEAGDARACVGRLRPVPSPDRGRASAFPRSELREALDAARRRHHARRESEERGPGTPDAA